MPARLCDYILKHPHWERAFPDSSRGDVIYTVLLHLKAGSVRGLIDPRARLLGVLLFMADKTRQELHINHLLTEPHIKALDWAAQLWEAEYPGWPVKMIRRGQRKTLYFDKFRKHFQL